MQTMRFLLFISWEHGLGSWSEGGERSSGGTLLAAECLAYRANISAFIKGHLWTRHSQLELGPLGETLGPSAIQEMTREGVWGT